MTKRAPLIATALSLLMLWGAAVFFTAYATRMEERYIHALAPLNLNQKLMGSQLQRQAFGQSDLLVIYGSSELNIGDPYHPSNLFRAYPTGFTVFPVGKAGTADLIILENLASVGDLRGKKVVISLSPPWFFSAGQPADNYAGNFSSLHAHELVFGPLSLDLKQAVAKRMLDYPKTVEGDPVLFMALKSLSATTPVQKLGYFVLWPVGKLQTFVLRLQDHWETLATIRSQPKLQVNVSRQSAALEWDNLLSKAIQEQEANANNNQFGIENARWLRDYQDPIPKQRGSRSDSSWLKSLEASKEWTDLDLLARGLREMGAEPLFISMPIKGLYYDYVGVTPQARQRYYDKLHETLGGLTVIDHAQFDGDRIFLIDPGAHLSRKGWVYTDQELDAFFHNRLP